MANPKDATFYDNQIERYLSQVLRAFSGFKVRDGVTRNGETYEEKVPVIFGSPSRVVAAILSNDSKFRNVKVPLMAVNLTGVAVDEEAKLNRFHRSEMAYARKSDGNVSNVDRMVGASLLLDVELNIYASSVSQLMELFERIVLTFNPEVVIQKSTEVFDSDYITSIRLEGISNEISSPLGQNHRTSSMSLQFSVPVRLSYPLQHQETLDSIRVKVIDEDSQIVNSDDIIDALDGTIRDEEYIPQYVIITDTGDYVIDDSDKYVIGV